MVDFVTDKEVVETFSDQFAPYEGYRGLDFSAPTPFRGTLFRLPLRTSDQAQTSTLSKRSLSSGEAIALLGALRDEASAMILFLKSIENM